MFTREEKMFLANKIQELLDDMNHPDLPKKKKIHFHLHINGIHSFSFCDVFNNRNVELVENQTIH